MTTLHVLLISSALNWVLVLGLALSVLRLRNVIVQQRRSPKPSSGPVIGLIAPALHGLALPPEEAETHVGSRPRLVWFMSSRCNACERSRPVVELIAHDFRERVESIVNLSGSGEQVSACGDWGTDVFVISDPDRSNARRWSVTRLPTVVLVEGSGIVRWRSNEAITVDMLRDVLTGALAVPEGLKRVDAVSPANGKSYGRADAAPGMMT